MSLVSIVEKFPKLKVLVIGDLILDQYIRGQVNRISPEAPVQIVEVEGEEKVLGGASNVANNARVLGANVFLAGLVGDDQNGVEFRSILEINNINDKCVITDAHRPTTTKVRVTAGRQQVVRFDYEKSEKATQEIESEMIEKIKAVFLSVDVVVLSDYAKGVISANLVQVLLNLTKDKGIPLLVDPRPKQANKYGPGMTIFTPNQREAYEMAGLESDASFEKVGSELVGRYSADILITQGSEGMTLFEKGGSINHIPTYAKEVYDIVGAGDTVIAALALSLAAGASSKEASQIANYAAGIVVSKAGTATASMEELLKKIQYEESNISG